MVNILPYCWLDDCDCMGGGNTYYHIAGWMIVTVWWRKHLLPYCWLDDCDCMVEETLIIILLAGSS